MLNDDIIQNYDLSENQFNELYKYTKTLYEQLNNNNNNSSNEKIICEVLSKTNNIERLYIREIYSNLYNKNIQDDFKSNKNLDSKFKNLCRMIFFSPIEFDCKQLHRSMHNFINDEDIICEIFATRPFWMLQDIDKKYVEMYKMTLRQDIEKETKNEFKKCLLSILNTERNKGKNLNEENYIELITKLNTNIKKIGNNIELFVDIFCKLSREDLIEFCRMYNQKYNKNIYDDINSNVSGSLKKLMKEILFGLINPSEYFSKKIFQSIQGLGTNANMLNRIIINRSEIDMNEIKQYYKLFKNVDIEKDIKGDVSGNYLELLLSLIQKS